MLPPLKEISNECVRVKKNKRDFSLAVRHTIIIVIDLIIVELFGVFPVVFFPSKRKDFPRKFCILVCDYYFGLLILLIILFGTQQMVSELRLVWKR